MQRTRSGRQGLIAGGFSYLWLLILIALFGLSMAAIGDTYVLDSRREKERELLFIGKEFETALARYSEVRIPGPLPGAPLIPLASPVPRNPSGASPVLTFDMRRFPASLEELVEDRRVEPPARHLRRIYLDPMIQTGEWGLVIVQGRILGIYSTSDKAPLKISGFDPEWEGFRSAGSYAKWVFAAPAARQVMSSATDVNRIP